jgi:nucleoside-diphosphate-sugar epimerase
VYPTSERIGKALVTGGTGFVGSHLVERLLSQGYSVRCLLRYPNKRRWLGNLPVEVVQGDITVPDSLPKAVEGVDAVIHLAGLTKAKSPEDFYHFNGTGTRNLLEACVNAKSPPRRFVYCSSQAAVGPSPPGHPMTGKDTSYPLTDYGKSKLEGEQEVIRIGSGIETVILRPSAVFGPRDTDVFIYFKILAKWRIKPYFGNSRNLLSLVYVKDLVDALILAMVVPKSQMPSEPLFVADPKPHSWMEVTSAMEKALGHRCIPVVFPHFLVMLTASISEIFAGRNPNVFNQQKAKEMLAASWWCDVKPTMEALDWKTITPLDEAMQETATWYREQGWISS